MSNDYEKGQKDMLSLIKDTYYKADKETFEQLLDAEDENEVRNFLSVNISSKELKSDEMHSQQKLKDLQRSMILRFNIEPQQQERPRATGRGRFIRVYDPPKTAKFKRELKQLAMLEMRDKNKFDSAISVTIRFYRKVQKSVSKKEHVRRTEGHVRPIVKPDLDNYIKSTLDALNGVIWTDDATIVELNTSKWYSDDPRIEIEVKELKNDEERNQN